MKERTVTIRLDPELDRLLERASADTGRSRSDLVRDALKCQLAIARFDKLRERTMPFAEGRGFLTDEDVFKKIS
jgi:predicted transcriptional regulator